jgi:hypothetical protein
MCIERGEMYSDPEFNSGNAFGQTDESLNELTDEQRESQFNFNSIKIDWKYPNPQDGYEFVSSSDGRGFDTSDLVQGALGDNWFIASVAIVASKP